MEIGGEGRTSNDVLLRDAKVVGNREGSGPGGSGRQSQDTVHSQSLTKYLQERPLRIIVS